MTTALAVSIREKDLPGAVKLPPVVSLRGVTKSRERSGSRFELRIPEFCVHPGEFIAVVGESGCGKSTLLDLLALISQPTDAVRFSMDFNVKSDSDVAAFWRQGEERKLAAIRRRYLGYVLQTGGLLPYLSVRENLMLPVHMNRVPGGRERIVAMAERIGVVDCLRRAPAALSGGQRQRVAILRALAHAPRLVLADEPTAAVDKKRAYQIVEDFYALAREENLAIIMVTHDFDLVRDLADVHLGFDVTSPATNSTLSFCRRQA